MHAAGTSTRERWARGGSWHMTRVRVLGEWMLQGPGGEGAAKRLRFALWSCDHMNVVKSNLARGERQLKVSERGVEDRKTGFDARGDWPVGHVTPVR